MNDVHFITGHLQLCENLVEFLSIDIPESTPNGICHDLFLYSPQAYSNAYKVSFGCKINMNGKNIHIEYSTIPSNINQRVMTQAIPQKFLILKLMEI